VLALSLPKFTNRIKATEIHIVPQQDTPIRLQEYGAGIFNLISTKSALKKAIKKQLISVNGAIASTATLIHGGEEISLFIPEENTATRKLIFPLKVIYEDEYLAAIHKPAGILVSGNSFKTIANALSQNLEVSPLADATLPQPVHRLDFATTGILLVGKTSSSIHALNKLFEDKEIKKTYDAVCIGKINSDGLMNSNIDGKPARAFYKIIESKSSNRFEYLNLLKLYPETGRRHQLRIQLSEIGNPILGDKDYGIENLILQGKGMYLHAYSLEFEHPFTKEKMLLIAETPSKFKKLFN